MSKLIVDSVVRYGQTRSVRVAPEDGQTGTSVKALVYRPYGFKSHWPVIAVMHGVNRCAQHYHATWMELAQKHGFGLVVPEFSSSDWRGSRRYNCGNVVRRDGRLLPLDRWAFTRFQLLMHECMKLLESSRTSFSMYGHSAGAQFVHRYVLVTGGAGLEAAVAANAGWYTLPSNTDVYPLGLNGLDLNRDRMTAAFKTPLKILLSVDDCDPNDDNLRTTADVAAQGAHRLARGRFFFEHARSLARDGAFEFRWSLSEVENAGHNDRETAEPAINHLLKPTSVYRSLAA